MLQTHAPVIFSVIVFILIPFRPFSTIHTKKICMCFRFDSLSRVFSNRCFFDENAQRILVDGRSKRSEMYALSNGTHYCGQGQKVMRISLFQGPRCNVQISWKLVQLTRGEWGRPAVTVKRAFQRFGHPHFQNPSDTGTPCNSNPNPNR